MDKNSFWLCYSTWKYRTLSTVFHPTASNITCISITSNIVLQVNITCITCILLVFVAYFMYFLVCLWTETLFLSSRTVLGKKFTAQPVRYVSFAGIVLPVEGRYSDIFLVICIAVKYGDSRLNCVWSECVCVFVVTCPPWGQCCFFLRNVYFAFVLWSKTLCSGLFRPCAYHTRLVIFPYTAL